MVIFYQDKVPGVNSQDSVLPIVKCPNKVTSNKQLRHLIYGLANSSKLLLICFRLAIGCGVKPKIDTPKDLFRKVIPFKEP